MDRRVEIEAAEALLDVGVSLPLLRIRLPWRRRPVEVRLTMRRPCLGSQIRMARLYMETGVTLEEMRGFNRHEELAYMAKHGKKLSRMVALTICRGKNAFWPGARSGGGLDAEVACGRPMGVRRRGAVCGAAGGEAFYEHYRIGGAGEPATAEDEPRKEGELTTEYVGSHSP